MAIRLRALGYDKPITLIGEEAHLPYQRPPAERCEAMARTLHQRGILTKLRQSAAQDVDGGCGQLRSRVTGVQRVQAPRSLRAKPELAAVEPT